MALPNFQLYYWACNLRALTYWQGSHYINNVPDWVQIESSTCLPSSLSALLFSPMAMGLDSQSLHPMVWNSIQIWAQIRKYLGWQRGSICAPVARNHRFSQPLNDQAFLIWQEKDILTFKDLFVDGCFLSFAQLESQFKIPKAHFFRYLQVRDFTHKNFPSFPSLPEQNPVDQLFPDDPEQRGTISGLYTKLVSFSTSVTTKRDSWQLDLNICLTDEEWNEAIYRIHGSSICARHSLIQFKVVYRLHLSKAKLANMYPSVDPICTRCKQSPATLAHMFWLCPSLSVFWSHIFLSYSRIFNKDVCANPLTAIFGIVCENNTLSKSELDCVAFTSLLARRLILINWKQSFPPSFKQWARDVLQFLSLEKIRLNLKGSGSKFPAIWCPFINDLQNQV